MQRILAAIVLLVLSLQPVLANERLEYLVRLNGLVTLFLWTDLADAVITTAPSNCAGRPCQATDVWMSSAGYAALESIAPTRFFYRSFYRLQTDAPVAHARTLAFEKREMKTGQKYQPYGHKHRLSVLENNQIVNYELSDQGDPLPAHLQQYLDQEYLQERALQPAVRQVRQRAEPEGVLDRWSMIQLARYLPLAPDYSASFAGTDGGDSLRFDLQVEDQASLSVAGEVFSAWQVAITETELKQDGTRDAVAGTIHLWISQDDLRLPLQLELKEDFGVIRFVLTSYRAATS